jgi:diguanylate cyclase (GGDEF)-like protein/PAS domain S-box-containing protein
MKDKPVILVVDDQPQNIELLEAYLVPQGYEIVKATNGEEALGKLSGNQIDLILLDVIMPGMDGFEVTRRVRQDNTLPIILVTALRETEDRVKGIEAGCDDFISKPVDKMELLARVRSLLRVKVYNDLMSRYLKALEATKISAEEAREYAESIINTVREPLIALDQDLRVVKVSRSFYDVFKVKPEETVGQLIYDLGNKQWDIPKLRELLETILPQKATFDNYEVEHDFTAIGRRIMLLNARQIQRMSGKERIILLAIEDITERKQSEEKIRQMAFHDSLTGLPNRKLFSDRLSIVLAHARRNQKKVGIAMLDLDNFKDVNDTLGHDVGDILLKATAEQLSAALRKGDTVARFGGDEFVLILPDLEVIEDAIQVAQKIVDRFRKPFLIDTHQLVVTTSIGIAVYPNDGIEEGILLKNADIAMFQAKQAGRARYQLYKKA